MINSDDEYNLYKGIIKQADDILPTKGYCTVDSAGNQYFTIFDPVCSIAPCSGIVRSDFENR